MGVNEEVIDTSILPCLSFKGNPAGVTAKQAIMAINRFGVTTGWAMEDQMEIGVVIDSPATLSFEDIYPNALIFITANYSLCYND